MGKRKQDFPAVVANYFLNETFLSRLFWWIIVAFLFLVAFGYMRYKWQQENDAPYRDRYQMEQEWEERNGKNF